MVAITTIEENIYEALKAVQDPEIPVLTVIDLGIITKVTVNENGEAIIKMTPTFVGCPAIDIMKRQVKEEAAKVDGVKEVMVLVDFEKQWTSDLLSEEAKKKLENFGLGTPVKVNGELTEEKLAEARCPHCKSDDTTINGIFGSTLCRSQHYCYNCNQAFERFKPLG